MKPTELYAYNIFTISNLYFCNNKSKKIYTFFMHNKIENYNLITSNISYVQIITYQLINNVEYNQTDTYFQHVMTFIFM